MLLLLLVLGYALSSFSVHIRKQTLEEAVQWQAAHYDISWFDNLEKEAGVFTSYDGYKLHTLMLHNPQPTNRYVLISHGYTDNHIGSLKYTKLYLDAGFNVLLYDLRGHGENADTFCTYSIREAKDIAALVQDFRNRFGTDVLLGIHGESLGAAASIACLKYQPDIQFVVADCAFSEIISVMKNGLHQMHLPAWLVYPASLWTKVRFGFSYQEMRPIDSLKAGGGTNYIPAIERAVEWSQAGGYDMIMLLSDGCPFEELDDIVAAAQEMKMPLNTVAVGAAAEDVLVNIALRTGGKEVTVDSFDQIRTPDVWHNEILPNIELVNKGEYSFGELMKHIQLDACASALHKFALNRIGDYSLTLPAIICGYINKPGFSEWLQAAAQRNTLSLQAEQMRDVDYFAAAESNEFHKLEEQLLRLCNLNNTASRVNISKGEPDTIVSLLSLRPLTAISDLQWASSMKFKE